MDRHLKHGLVFAVVCTVALLMLNMIAWAGVETAATISYAVLIPFAWLWGLLGIPACQAIGYIGIIILLVPVYYLIIGFIVGFLLSLLVERIRTKKEEKHYSKQSPQDLNNGSPGCSEAEPGD